MQSYATETNQILWFYSFFRFSISKKLFSVVSPPTFHLAPRSLQAQAKLNYPNLRPFWKKILKKEVIGIQCFHWPNISTCGKYLSACVMSERYFDFTCCSIRISARTRKRKKLILVLVLMPASRPHGEIRIIVFALVLPVLFASLVKTRLKT